MFTAIYGWARTRQIPATYTAISMLFSNLKHLELSPDDLIVVAIDSPKGSWRKEVDKEYKANRKELRKKSDIDWNYWFTAFNDLLINLDRATPFILIKIDKLEADDIIAEGVKYFKDRECIIVSSDTDYEQLTSYSNVKIFSPKAKRFKEVSDPYKKIAEKINKEKTDNLVSPVLNLEDYKKRKSLVSLIDLPKDVTEKVDKELDKIKDKDFDIRTLRFKKLIPRFMEIYNAIPRKKTKRELLAEGMKKLI